MGEMPLRRGSVDECEPGPPLILLPAQWRARILWNIAHRARGESAFLFEALMLANVVAYAYHVLMARMLSPADYGTVVTLTSISYVLDVVVRTVQAGLTKTVAAAKEKSGERARHAFTLAMRTVVALAGVTLVSAFLAGRWAAGFLHLDAATPVILLGAYASLTFLGPVPRGVLLGLNRLHRASVSIILEPVGRLIVGVAFVAYGLRVDGALIGYAMGSLLALAIAWVLLWPLLAKTADRESETSSLEGMDRYAALVLLANICLMVMASIDQVVVKHFFSIDEAGNYAVAFVLGRVILMGAISLGIVVFTRSTAMHPTDPRRAMVLAKGLLAMGAIAGTATAVSLAAPTSIVRLIAGSQYASAHTFVGLVGVEMTLFGLVYVQAYYHLSLGKMQVVWPLFLASALAVALLVQFHASIQQVLTILISVMGALLICVSALSWRDVRAARRQTAVVLPEPPQGIAGS